MRGADRGPVTSESIDTINITNYQKFKDDKGYHLETDNEYIRQVYQGDSER